jgi:HD-like signal output (HDOD) protein
MFSSIRRLLGSRSSDEQSQEHANPQERTRPVAVKSAWDFGALVAHLEPAIVPLEKDPEIDPASDALAAKILEAAHATKPSAESFPALSLQVLSILSAPQIDEKKLSRLITADSALSGALLRVANSGVYGGLSVSQTVREAIARLGFGEVARVAGAVSARALFQPKLRAQYVAVEPQLNRLAQRAVSIAFAASWIALRKPACQADRAYLAGLMHTLGKSVALRGFATLVAENKVELPSPLVLSQALDKVHSALGSEVARSWSLPAYVVEAIEQLDGGKFESADLHAVRLFAALIDLRDGQTTPNNCDRLVKSAMALSVDRFELRVAEAELKQLSKRAQALLS